MGLTPLDPSLSRQSRKMVFYSLRNNLILVIRPSNIYPNTNHSLHQPLHLLTFSFPFQALVFSSQLTSCTDTSNSSREKRSKALSLSERVVRFIEHEIQILRSTTDLLAADWHSLLNIPPLPLHPQLQSMFVLCIHFEEPSRVGWPAAGCWQRTLRD